MNSYITKVEREVTGTKFKIHLYNAKFREAGRKKEGRGKIGEKKVIRRQKRGKGERKHLP